MSDFDNTAALWRRKPTEKDKEGVKYPNFTGNITVGGVKKQLAAWLNTEKANENQPDISLKISEITKKEGSSF